MTQAEQYVYGRWSYADRACPGCGLEYVRESSTDRALHRRMHAARTAGWQLPRELRADDVRLARQPEIVVKVDVGAPARWRNRAEHVASLANREVGYDFPMYATWHDEWISRELVAYQRTHDTTALVAYDPADRRAIGLLVYEFKPGRWGIRWRTAAELADRYAKLNGDDIHELERDPTAGQHQFTAAEDVRGLGRFWTVKFVWAHRRVRRNGLASRLLTHMLGQVGVRSTAVLAWEHPLSLAGAAFARHWCPDGAVLA